MTMLHLVFLSLVGLALADLDHSKFIFSLLIHSRDRRTFELLFLRLWRRGFLFLGVRELVLFKKKISSSSEFLSNNSLFGGQL